MVEELQEHDFTMEEAAYHEAGHALAMIYLGLSFDYVTIDRDGDSLGHVGHGKRQFRSIPFVNPHAGWSCCEDDEICERCAAHVKFAESAIVAALGGPVALSSYRRSEDRDYGDSADQIESAEICRKVFGDDSDEKISARLQPLLGRAQLMILNHKSQVELKAVVDALLSKGRLSDSEVRTVVRKAEDGYTLALVENRRE
jgi:hypothetical protein